MSKIVIQPDLQNKHRTKKENQNKQLQSTKGVTPNEEITKNFKRNLKTLKITY
jgi:hypothetical protein